MRHDKHDKWECETLKPKRKETKKEAEDPKTQLNELDAEGWRFVDTIDYTGGETKPIVFERPVRPNENTDEDSS